MDIFREAFERERKPNTKKRTFSNVFAGLKKGYVVFFQSATNDYLRGNFQSALNNINKAIEESDINDWQHFAFRAKVYEDLKNYQQSINDYVTGIELAKHDELVYALYHQIGYCYLNLKNDLKALEFYTYAINLKKQHPNYSNCPDQEGMNGGIMLGVQFKRMYNNRANAHFNLSHIDEAIKDCDIAISYDKQYSNPYLLKAQIYSKIGQVQESVNYTKIAAQLGNQTAKLILQRLGY